MIGLQFQTGEDGGGIDHELVGLRLEAIGMKRTIEADELAQISPGVDGVEEGVALAAGAFAVVENDEPAGGPDIVEDGGPIDLPNIIDGEERRAFSSGLKGLPRFMRLGESEIERDYGGVTAAGVAKKGAMLEDLGGSGKEMGPVRKSRWLMPMRRKPGATR